MMKLQLNPPGPTDGISFIDLMTKYVNDSTDQQNILTNLDLFIAVDQLNSFDKCVAFQERLCNTNASHQSCFYDVTDDSGPYGKYLGSIGIINLNESKSEGELVFLLDAAHVSNLTTMTSMIIQRVQIYEHDLHSIVCHLPNRPSIQDVEKMLRKSHFIDSGIDSNGYRRFQYIIVVNDDSNNSNMTCNVCHRVIDRPHSTTETGTCVRCLVAQQQVVLGNIHLSHSYVPRSPILPEDNVFVPLVSNDHSPRRSRSNSHSTVYGTFADDPYDDEDNGVKLNDGNTHPKYVLIDSPGECGNDSDIIVMDALQIVFEPITPLSSISSTAQSAGRDSNRCSPSTKSSSSSSPDSLSISSSNSRNGSSSVEKHSASRQAEDKDKSTTSNLVVSEGSENNGVGDGFALHRTDSEYAQRHVLNAVSNESPEESNIPSIYTSTEQPFSPVSSLASDDASANSLTCSAEVDHREPESEAYRHTPQCAVPDDLRLAPPKSERQLLDTEPSDASLPTQNQVEPSKHKRYVVPFHDTNKPTVDELKADLSPSGVDVELPEKTNAQDAETQSNVQTGSYVEDCLKLNRELQSLRPLPSTSADEDREEDCHQRLHPHIQTIIPFSDSPDLMPPVMSLDGVHISIQPSFPNYSMYLNNDECDECDSLVAEGSLTPRNTPIDGSLTIPTAETVGSIAEPVAGLNGDNELYESMISLQQYDTDNEIGIESPTDSQKQKERKDRTAIVDIDRDLSPTEDMLEDAHLSGGPVSEAVEDIIVSILQSPEHNSEHAAIFEMRKCDKRQATKACSHVAQHKVHPFAQWAMRVFVIVAVFLTTLWILK